MKIKTRELSYDEVLKLPRLKHRKPLKPSPIYDLAFEFSEGFALVKVGDEWHFIDKCGEPAIHCGRGVGIKPFKGGVSRISREDGDFVIYCNGRVERV